MHFAILILFRLISFSKVSNEHNVKSMCYSVMFIW